MKVWSRSQGHRSRKLHQDLLNHNEEVAKQSEPVIAQCLSLFFPSNTVVRHPVAMDLNLWGPILIQTTAAYQEEKGIKALNLCAVLEHSLHTCRRTCIHWDECSRDRWWVSGKRIPFL